MTFHTKNFSIFRQTNEKQFVTQFVQWIFCIDIPSLFAYAYYRNYHFRRIQIMDTTFYELLVPKSQRTAERVVLIASISLAIVITIFAFMMNPLFAVVILILDFLFYSLVLPKFYVEYEYILLHQELDIDVVYKKAKRKSLISLNLKEARIIAPASSNRLVRNDVAKTLDYSSRDNQNPPYAIVISLNQSLTRVLFQPDEKMIALLQKAFPSTFFME